MVTPCRPEIQNADGSAQCHGLGNDKTEDGDEEEEELEEEDDDSLTGKSQDETASPTTEPQGGYEDEEEEEATPLAMSFDRTRRWVGFVGGRKRLLSPPLISKSWGRPQTIHLARLQRQPPRAALAPSPA